MRDKERISSAFIPTNFQTGVNLLGQTYSLINVVEGAALFTLITLGSFILLRKFIQFEVSTIIGISITLGLPLGMLGLIGINDESIHVFIFNIMKFIKNRRTAYYNPRIKNETRPIDLSEFKESDFELLPRDKVMKMYESFKKIVDEKDRKKMLENEANLQNGLTMVFEDDNIDIASKK